MHETASNAGGVTSTVGGVAEIFAAYTHLYAQWMYPPWQGSDAVKLTRSECASQQPFSARFRCSVAGAHVPEAGGVPSPGGVAPPAGGLPGLELPGVAGGGDEPGGVVGALPGGRVAPLAGSFPAIESPALAPSSEDDPHATHNAHADNRHTATIDDARIITSTS